MNKKKVGLHVGICGLLAIACGFYVSHVVQWIFTAVVFGVLLLAVEPALTKIMPASLYGKLCIASFGALCLGSIGLF